MIKTSNHKWLRTAIRFYKEKKEFDFVDDASLGIEKFDLESGLSLIKKAEQTGIPWKKISVILTKEGLCPEGSLLIGTAITDPKPTNKLHILLSAGAVSITKGNSAILKSLKYVYNVTSEKKKFKVEPL